MTDDTPAEAAARAWLHSFGIETECYRRGGMDHPAMRTLPQAFEAHARAALAAVDRAQALAEKPEARGWCPYFVQCDRGCQQGPPGTQMQRCSRAIELANQPHDPTAPVAETGKPDFPPWSREIGILIMALGAAVSGMAMKSDNIQELRWPNGERQLKSGATTATMLDDFLRAAFPETQDAG